MLCATTMEIKRQHETTFISCYKENDSKRARMLRRMALNERRNKNAMGNIVAHAIRMIYFCI